jgi:hypothetical protein
LRTKGVAPLRYNTEMKEFLAFSYCPVRGMRAWLALMLTLFAGPDRLLHRTAGEGITVVSPFDVNRYAGKWYEIAPHGSLPFERGA